MKALLNGRLLMVLAALTTLAILILAACAPAAQPTAAPVAPAAPKQPQAPAAPAAPTAAAAPMAQPTSVPGATSRPPASLDKATIDKLTVANLAASVPDIRYADIENVRYGGTYRAMSHQSTASLDVAISYSGGSSLALGVVLESLFALRPNPNDYGSKLGPELAESWTVSPDIKTYTVKLKKGIHWQNVPPVNGREFVAKDVKFSYEQYMLPVSGAYAVYSQIVSIDTPDNYTVVIHLQEPNGFLFDQLMQPRWIIPYDLPDRRNTAIGTGPFIITRFTAGTGVGTGVTAVRNPDYWGKDEKGRQLPYVDRYEYISISETATKMAAMRTGQVDQVDNLSADDVVNLLHSTPDIQVVKNPIEVYGGSGGGFSIVFNTKLAPWNDPKMRCAVSKAIDKEKVAIISTGAPGVPRGPIPFTLIFDRLITDDDLGPCYKYDPQGAKTLLSQFGVSLQKPLTVTLDYGNVGDWATVDFVTRQAMLAEVGINVNLRRIDWTTYTSSIYKRDFKEWAVGWGPTQRTIATVSFKFGSNGRNNFSGIESPETDAKLLQLQGTTDPVRQRQILRELWDDFLNNTVEVLPRQRVDVLPFSGHTRNLFARNNLGAGFTSENGGQLWFSDAPRTSP